MKSEDKAMARAKRFVEEFRWMFDVSMYEIQFYKKIADEERGEVVTSASIEVDERYQTIDINLYPIFFTKNLDIQRKILLHEMCHILNTPLQSAAESLLAGKLITDDMISEASEKATSRMENIIDALLKGNLTYAKNAYKDYLK